MRRLEEYDAWREAFDYEANLGWDEPPTVDEIAEQQWIEQLIEAADGEETPT
jgi:hypothetical protein